MTGNLCHLPSFQQVFQGSTQGKVTTRYLFLFLGERLRHIHALQRDYSLVAGIKLIVVLEYQVHKLITIHLTFLVALCHRMMNVPDE